jgi:hypothetical protein
MRSPFRRSLVAHDFDVSGGDASGAAYGADAFALVNGATVNAIDGELTVTTDDGEYRLQFHDGFEGAFDPIVIESTLSEIQLQGGDETGTDFGADTEAEINGTTLVSLPSGVVRVSATYPRITMRFQPEYSGEFDTVTVTRPGRLVPQPARRKSGALAQSARTATSDVDARIQQIRDRIQVVEGLLSANAASRATTAYQPARALASLQLRNIGSDFGAF